MNKLTVFHIENEIIIALAVKRMLIDIIPGVNVHNYFNGKEAADFLKTNYSIHKWPKLILLDITMPVMDGWGFLDFWRTLPENLTNKTSLYMLSSSNEQEDIDKAMRTGVVKNFITKPLCKEYILKIISENSF